jgi:hypothetical protein
MSDSSTNKNKHLHGMDLDTLREFHSLACKMVLPRYANNGKLPLTAHSFSPEFKEILSSYYEVFDNWNSEKFYSKSNEQTIKRVIDDYVFGKHKVLGRPHRKNLNKDINSLKSSSLTLRARKKILKEILWLSKYLVQDVVKRTSKDPIDFAARERYPLLIFTTILSVCYLQKLKNALPRNLVEEEYFNNLTTDEQKTFRKYYRYDNSGYYRLQKKLLKFPESWEIYFLMFYAKKGKPNV